MSVFSAMAPALRLISTFDGRVKVHIDDSKFAGLASNPLAGCNAGSIKSVSLFVKQSDKPYKFYSNTLNGPECTYSDDGVLRIVSDVEIASALEKPASYNATLTLNFGETSSVSVTGSFTVVGDMITPEIKLIRQGDNAGTSLKLKVSPNSFDGLNNLIITDLSSVIIVKDGAMLAERNYEPTGVYDMTGLIVNQEYSFAVIMKSKGGYLSEVSETVSKRPVMTPEVGTLVGNTGTHGDYFINTGEINRGALVASATDEEQRNHQLTKLDVYAYVHAADDLLVAAVPESMYTKVGTVNAVVNTDKSSVIPASQLHIEGAFNGCLVRFFARASNGHGQGISKAGAEFRVDGAPSQPVVACALLSANKYEITVEPGAAVAGYTLIGHKVEVKARSAANWNTTVGTFTEVSTDAKDTWSVNGVAYLRAIEKVTSSNQAGKSDVVSSKAFSKVNFQLTTVGAFDVRAQGIYRLTRDLTKVVGDVLGSDLRLFETDRKLVYGSADKVFADAGEDNSILTDSTGSAYSLVENVTPVAAISSATWGPNNSAAFMAAAGNNATFEMSMDRFNLGNLLNNNNVPFNYETHSVKYSIIKKGLYPEYSEIASLYGRFLDQGTIKQQFIIVRGEKSEVGVQVSVYDKLNKLVAQSTRLGFISLIPSGQGAYSGLVVMTNAEQGVVAYPEANAVGADVKSVLNFDATGATAITCAADIAMEGSADASEDANMNHPAFLAAGWNRATKIFRLDEEGKETGANLAGTAVAKTFNETNKPNRSFLVHTLDGLQAMKPHSFRVRRDWSKGAETLLDTEPFEFTVIPTIAAQKRDVTFVAGDGAVNCSFEKSAAAEVNQEYQQKAIKALGGVFNAVLVKDSAGKYTELDQSSSAHFTSPLANGPRILSSRAQYLNPSFGAEYSIDERWVMSDRTDDQSLDLGPSPDQLNATVESVKNLAGDHGCLFTFDKPDADHTVTIRAVFDDASHVEDDSHAEIVADLTDAKYFMKHDDIMIALGLSAAQYYGVGVTFLIIHKDDATDVESLPKAIFHMPKGLTTFVAGDFAVKSGAGQLAIMYTKIDDHAIEDHAGNYEIPATITYTETANGRKQQTLRVADLTSANGIVIGGLNNSLKYALSVAIDGQPGALALGDKSPAALPNAVADLAVEVLSETSLKVKFAASINNGEYSADPSNKVYVSYLANDVTRYLSAATGTLADLSSGKVGIALQNAELVLNGLKSGVKYAIEVESTFAGDNDGNSEQKVSAFKTDVIPCAHPEIKDFRLDEKNQQARLLVNLKGAVLMNLILLASNGSVMNFDVQDFQVAQLAALSKPTGEQFLALNIDLSKNPTVTNIAVIAASSKGAIMAAANSAQGAAATVVSASDYNAVVRWTNI